MFLSLSRWVFLSVLICVCQALFFSQCGNDEFSDVDMISSDTTKRFNMFKAFVLWHVEFNCRWRCGVVVRFVMAIWFCVFFCAVCVDVFDVDFLSGFGCLLFGTLTEKGTEKLRRVQVCKVLFRMGRFCCCRNFLACVWNFGHVVLPFRVWAWILASKDQR